MEKKGLTENKSSILQKMSRFTGALFFLLLENKGNNFNGREREWSLFTALQQPKNHKKPPYEPFLSLCIFMYIYMRFKTDRFVLFWLILGKVEKIIFSIVTA